MNDHEGAEAVGIVCKFWNYFNLCEWDSAKNLLAEDFEAYWPQSKERVIGRDNFIEINRNYPGSRKIQVENSQCEYDRWDKIYKVSTITNIKWEKPNGKKEELYAISFFEIDSDEIINSALEYWAVTYPAPAWRKHLVEVLK